MRKFPDSLRLISRHWRLAKKRTGLRVTTKPAASRLPKQGIAAGNEVQRVTGGSHGQVETRLQYHTGLVNPACFPASLYATSHNERTHCHDERLIHRHDHHR